MTKVIAELGETFFSLQAKGHATGSETVCAAVSCLVFALAGYLENAVADGFARWIDRRLESGDAVLSVSTQEACQSVEAAFQMAVIGLLQLEQAEPERVSVTVALK